MAGLFLLACLIFAADAFGSSNRKGDWSVHKTRHFRIVYHDEVAAQADFARDFLEGAYRAMLDSLRVSDRGVIITVVLTGRVDESNGYATPLGHKIVIWTRPGQAIAAGDLPWLRRVLAHELAHMVSFLVFRNAFGVYGEIYKMASMPVWFLEGLAQYLGEAWDAKRNTFFAHALHNSALEAYPAMAAFLENDPVSGRLVYEQGHAFVRYLAAGNGGPAFLGRLLRKVTVIPVWNEAKALLSPLTARWLPLESALLSLTGKGITAHWSTFLYALEEGQPRGRDNPPPPLVAGAGPGGWDLVFQARRAGPDEWILTAQEDWDRPYVSLVRVAGGRAEPLGPKLVNPVFDLSPSGERLAYVKDYTDVDGEPVNRLMVRGLAGAARGEEWAVSDGAYHPAFLSEDTVAFSRWKSGRQVLTLCAVGGAPASVGGAPACREEVHDSLIGFYALSRSARGLLMNATTAAGRTGIWEWSREAGFQRILQDTVLAEFPVEAPDGSILMIREIGGLMQVGSLDRSAGTVAPARSFPVGAFFLHRAAPGIVAAVAQVGEADPWRLAPVEIKPPERPAPASAPSTALPAANADTSNTTLATYDTTTADSSARLPRARRPGQVSAAPSEVSASAFRAPAFLLDPPILPVGDSVSPRARPGRAYLSLLEMRPLVIWPYLAASYPWSALGAGGLLQDPLELHTLSGSIGSRTDKDHPLYGVEYVNAQTPAQISLFSGNEKVEVDSLAGGVDGWKRIDAVVQTTVTGMALLFRPPWSLPDPHAVFLGLETGYEWTAERLAGERDSGGLAFQGWSRAEGFWHHQVSLGYTYALPYAYSVAHPLRETSLFLGHLRRYPGGDDWIGWSAFHAFPLHGEFTLTAAWDGTLALANLPSSTYPVPGWGEVTLHHRRDRGIAQDLYASLDLPLLKGYLFEMPLFGICNYVGAGTFAAYGFESWERNPDLGLPPPDEESLVAGARLYGLFHVMRKLPLVLSGRVQWNFRDEAYEYVLGTEVGGVPSAVSGLFAPSQPRGGLSHRLRRPLHR